MQKQLTLLLVAAALLSSPPVDAASRVVRRAATGLRSIARPSSSQLTMFQQRIPLFRAATSRHFSASTLDATLLEKAAVRCSNYPIHAAITEDNIDAIKTLAASGDYSIDALNHYGFAPLHLAAFLNNPKALETLLTAGAYVDIIGGTGIGIDSNMTPLMTAIQRDAASAAYVLIRHHAQINAVDSNGLTPLHYAVLSKNPELTNALINHNAYLDVRCYDLGMTPLHYAIPFLEGDDITNATEIVSSLVQAGADVNVLDRFRLTALDMAKDFAEEHREMVEIVHILERSGAKTGKEILDAAEAHNQAAHTS